MKTVVKPLYRKHIESIGTNTAGGELTVTALDIWDGNVQDDDKLRAVLQQINDAKPGAPEYCGDGLSVAIWKNVFDAALDDQRYDQRHAINVHEISEVAFWLELGDECLEVCAVVKVAGSWMVFISTMNLFHVREDFGDDLKGACALAMQWTIHIMEECRLDKAAFEKAFPFGIANQYRKQK